MELITYKGFMLATCDAIEFEHPMFAREVRKQQDLLEQKDTLIESKKKLIKELNLACNRWRDEYEDLRSEKDTVIESLKNDLRIANDWESDAYSWRDFCNDRDNVSEEEFTEDNFTLMKSELYELRTNYDHFNKTLKENDVTIESQKEEIKKLTTRIDARESNNTLIRKELSEAHREIEALQKEIAELKNEMVGIRNIAIEGLNKHTDYHMSVALKSIKMAVEDVCV